MKSECGRFEYIPEIGIKDYLSGRHVNLDGTINQIPGLEYVIFTEETKAKIKNFIEKISPFVKELDKKAKIGRLKDKYWHEFNKVLNEGYVN